MARDQERCTESHADKSRNQAAEIVSRFLHRICPLSRAFCEILVGAPHLHHGDIDTSESLRPSTRSAGRGCYSHHHRDCDRTGLGRIRPLAVHRHRQCARRIRRDPGSVSVSLHIHHRLSAFVLHQNISTGYLRWNCCLLYLPGRSVGRRSDMVETTHVWGPLGFGPSHCIDPVCLRSSRCRCPSLGRCPPQCIFCHGGEYPEPQLGIIRMLSNHSPDRIRLHLTNSLVEDWP